MEQTVRASRAPLRHWTKHATKVKSIFPIRLIDATFQSVSSTLAGLSLRDLEYVVAVADLRRFGRAADRCGVSQAGLSEQLRKLEELLGLTLFERSTRRVIVTPDGEAVARQARDVLTAARAILEMARSRKGPLSGPLKLGVIATLGPYYVPDMLWAVREQFPSWNFACRKAGRTNSFVLSWPESWTWRCCRCR